MATIGLSDFGPDIARFPRNMVAGDKHQTASIRSESTKNLAALAQAARLPNTPSTQARIPVAVPSTTSTPHSSQKHSASRSRATSQNKLSTALGAEPAPGEPPPPNRSVALPSATQEQEETYKNDGTVHNNSASGGISSAHASVPPSPRLEPTQRSMLSFTGSGSASPSRIKVRDLSHIQSFASEEFLARSRQGSSHSLKGQRTFGQQYEISAMPVTDVIEMIAGLLTKITTTNDQQHEHLHRHIPPPEGTSSLTQQATSVLAFHGKNAPSITILSYLSRIHKYCPTTYEVFLSLLVYFDRMTEAVNSGSLTVFGDERPTNETGTRKNARATEPPERAGSLATPPSSGQSDLDAYNLSQFFVVDSYNIHR